MDENTSSAPQPASSNKNMLLVGVFVVIALAVLGGVFLMGQSKKTDEQSMQAAQVSPTPEGAMVEVTEETVTTTPEAAMTDGEEKTFTIESTPFKFNPATITVNEGDTVKITLNNKTGTHDFVIDEITGAKTKVLQAGQSETITFVADKAGTYEYYCSVGNHRQMGMVGKLIVQ